tara:strand:- start:3215 stop:3403 length:189 start_codon:yes stop_codon:yes gene_type:complete
MKISEFRKFIREEIKAALSEMNEAGPGLWANIHAKRKRGGKASKPGDKNYPEKKAWDKAKGS